MIYYSDSNFEPFQIEYDLMHRLVYYFNPCLKFIFHHYGNDRFMQYGYNSCLQTAILGAACCKFDLQNNCIVKCYEGDFDESIGNEQIKYTHAYFRLIIDSHDWLVDLSRTTKKLLFTQVTPGRIYPHNVNCPDYYNIKVGNIRELPFEEMITMKEPEWITGIRPIELFQKICQMISDMNYWSSKKKKDFVTKIYEKFTALQLERNEFC